MRLNVQGNPGTANHFEETNVEHVDTLCPNATHTVQNIYIGDRYASEAMNALNGHGSEPVTAQVYDMYYLSSTRPSPISNEILRKQDLKLCESRLATDNILYLTGEDGVGLTNIISQFARQHPNNCVSYFNNGLDRQLINPEYLEHDIAQQLYRYTTLGSVYDANMAEHSTIDTVIHRVMRRMSSQQAPLYFVFDGFDKIPSELVDGIRKVFGKFIWSRMRFIFTGDSSKIQRLIPENPVPKSSTQQILPFSDGDVNQYFRNIVPGLSDDELGELRRITRCQASRMSIVCHNYIEKGRLQDLLQSGIDEYSDLYEDDFKRLFDDTDSQLPYKFLTLIAYAEFYITDALAAEILGVTVSEIGSLLERYHNYVTTTDNGRLVIISEGFHKYLREKFSAYKQDIELQIIRVLELPGYEQDYCRYIPALYKDLKLTDKLISYLNNDNVRRIIVNQQSQAALNEQCEYGYEACNSDIEKYAAGIFRFALNKSTSREVEGNRLLDHEIEANLAIDNIDQAIALAQSVYLTEERLKSFALIARKKKMLSATDYAIIKESIDSLVAEIQFERIPEKAIELAKLLLPVDYQIAIGIVDRIAKSNKNSINTDSIYTLMSLMSTPSETGKQENASRDLLDTRIQNKSLRSLAHAAKSLFADETTDVFLQNLASLPGNSQKLHLLEMWIPEHEDKENIGKVVLEGIKLIVAESDTSMPRARMLYTFCRAMSKMTADEMESALTYIDSLTDTIKYPTLDYVDAELAVIEAMRERMPERAMSRLETIYLYIDDLSDESVRLACLSKFLGRYDRLGCKTEIERDITSTVALRKEISAGISKLLQTTADHAKIVEEPIKALVCGYRTMIGEFISQVNTAGRRSRSYSLAAWYYVLSADAEKFDTNYFFSLVGKADNIYADRIEPLELFTERLLNDCKLNMPAILPQVKSSFSLFDEIEIIPRRCRVYIQLYRWIVNNFPDDTFAGRLKEKIMSSWRTIAPETLKIEYGFYIAKEMSRVSNTSAIELVNECNELKKHTRFISSSCLRACDDAIDLYTRSLCYLIRFGLCEKHHLSHFQDEVDSLHSEEDKAVRWGKIAAEYYLANNHSQFLEICNSHLPADYSHLPIFSQRRAIYYNAGVLFLYGSDRFFALLSQYDETFRNDCIWQASRFVYAKYAELADVTPGRKEYDIAYDDYRNLLTLMEHSTSEDYFYHICTVISDSMRKGRPNKPLSSEQKKFVVAEAKRIVEKVLPTSIGIRHDGYKIACLAMLDYAITELSNKDKKKWQELIATVDNVADQAFLNFAIGPFFQRKHDREEFFNRGLELTNGIHSAYDKVNRLDMSITECVENGMGGMVKDIAGKAMECLACDGTMEDHKRLVDAVYQQSPDLAERMLDSLDHDPARMHYKTKLLDHISSKKKLDQAHKEQSSIDNLTREEQFKFFSQQMSDLACGKAQLLDLQRLFKLSIKHIYENDLSHTQNAICYLVESLYRKYGRDRLYRELLLSIHSTIRYNLKLVMSLAAKTKDSLAWIEENICRNQSEAANFVGVGEYDKAEELLLQWVDSHRFDTLYIIDPYFTPDGLYIIKKICDINNDAGIFILCHERKVTPSDFTIRWHSITNGVTNRINVHFVHYEGKPDDGPLHDRYWICIDEETDSRHGIKPPSLNNIGSKECSICDISEADTQAAYDIFNKYANRCPKHVGDHQMEYDRIELS